MAAATVNGSFALHVKGRVAVTPTGGMLHLVNTAGTATVCGHELGLILEHVEEPRRVSCAVCCLTVLGPVPVYCDGQA